MVTLRSLAEDPEDAHPERKLRVVVLEEEEEEEVPLEEQGCLSVAQPTPWTTIWPQLLLPVALMTEAGRVTVLEPPPRLRVLPCARLQRLWTEMFMSGPVTMGDHKKAGGGEGKTRVVDNLYLR